MPQLDARPTPALRRSRRFAALVATLLVVACESGPTLSPPAEAPVTAPVAEASPTTSRTPGPSPSPAETLAPIVPTTTRDKVLAGLQDGTLDPERALLYRIFAIFGDPRLPPEYAGERSEDLEAIEDAQDGLDSFSAATQALLRPYLVRPTDPTSYWNLEPPSAASVELAVARSESSRALQPPLFARACVDGWMHDQVSSNIPVMIWSQCAGPDPGAEAHLEEARGDLAVLWQPETSLMGEPIGDRNVPNDGYADLPETGDGLIDIYLLGHFSPSGHPRNFGVGTSYAHAASTPPFAGAAGATTASGYIVVREGLSGLDLESTLAHEFFHVLQFAHNRQGTLDCPIAQLGSCPNSPRAFHWFVEASATWAEHRFVPAARATKDGPYDRFGGWRTDGIGLSRLDGNNAYHSWMWPLFMQQQAGPSTIGSAWQAFEGKRGWNQIQAALDGVVPFEQTFREFGVRGWNELLKPGDPLVHHYFDASLDGSFPQQQPEGDRLLETIEMNADDNGPSIETLDIDSLAPQYLEFYPGADAHTLVFDFVALAPEVDVDAIVRLKDNSWERRELPHGQVTWCLDKPADSIQEGIFVFSNHDQRPARTTRTWSWDATRDGCGVQIGTLVYSFLDTAPIMSQPGGHQAVDASVQVNLKLNKNIGSPYVAMYLNDGSTYGITTASKTLLVEGPDGCAPTFNSVGTPGGALEVDSVVGNTWVDEQGKNRLTLGISLPLHVETEEFWCALGSTHSSRESLSGFPSCDGVETDSTKNTQTFSFDCDFQGTSQSWSVDGTIVIDRAR